MWIGHFAGDSTDWFLTWAKTDEQALEQVKADLGEPEKVSLAPLAGHGYLLFRVRPDQGDPRQLAIEAPEGERLILGDARDEAHIARVFRAGRKS